MLKWYFIRHFNLEVSGMRTNADIWESFIYILCWSKPVTLSKLKWLFFHCHSHPLIFQHYHIAYCMVIMVPTRSRKPWILELTLFPNLKKTHEIYYTPPQLWTCNATKVMKSSFKFLFYKQNFILGGWSWNCHMTPHICLGKLSVSSGYIHTKKL